MESMQFYAMGSHMTALLDADEENAWSNLERVPLWFEEWEQKLSRFREDSELTLANSLSGQITPVSPLFAEVLDLAMQMERESEGLVTPAILPALESIGYDRSFDLLDDLKTHSKQSATQSAISTHGLEWKMDDRMLFLPKGMRLDFGGVAKGWAAHQAAQRLAASGPALVNAGGDIAISGPMLDDSPWMIGIRNPFNADTDLGVMPVLQGGVATSGSDYRHWQQDGQRRHHLIDPRSGVSAETDLIQVTVLAPTVMQAEMAAKTIYILGSQAGFSWLDSHPDCFGILIQQDGSILHSKEMTVEFYQELSQ
jgi:thiamine biosynthesis lipoprotein